MFFRTSFRFSEAGTQTSSAQVPGGSVPPPAATGSQSDTGAGRQESKPGDGTSGDVDLATLPDHVQKYIKDLRTEAASHRKEARGAKTELEALTARLKGIAGGEDADKMTPEQKIEFLANHGEALGMRNMILETAYNQDIPKEGLEYFEFLLSKRMASMEENGEITDEDISAIAEEVRSKHEPRRLLGNTAPQGGAKQPAPAGGAGQMTVEQFDKMTMVEKAALYGKQPELYKALMAESANNPKNFTRKR